MWPGVKSCCKPDGHCKTKPPTKQNRTPECKQIAFEHQKSVDLHIELSVLPSIKVDLPVRTVEAFARSQDINLVGPSPPDLNVLHSAFLI
jgi:hypothetical protein